MDAPKSPEDSPKVGDGDGLPTVSPNEKGRKNPNKNKSSEEDVNKKKTIIKDAVRNYTIVKDEDGGVVSINDKEGKPLTGRKLAKAEKQILEDTSVDDGKKVDANPSMMTPELTEVQFRKLILLGIMTKIIFLKIKEVELGNLLASL